MIPTGQGSATKVPQDTQGMTQPKGNNMKAKGNAVEIGQSQSFGGSIGRSSEGHVMNAAPKGATTKQNCGKEKSS